MRRKPRPRSRTRSRGSSSEGSSESSNPPPPKRKKPKKQAANEERKGPSDSRGRQSWAAIRGKLPSVPVPSSRRPPETHHEPRATDDHQHHDRPQKHHYRPPLTRSFKRGPEKKPREEHRERPHEEHRERPHEEHRERPHEEHRQKPHEEQREKQKRSRYEHQREKTREEPGREHRGQPSADYWEKPEREPRRWQDPRKWQRGRHVEEQREIHKDEQMEKPRRETWEEPQNDYSPDATQVYPTHQDHSKGPRKHDIIFISIIWTTEMVYNGFDITLNRLIHDHFTTKDPTLRETGVKGTINSGTIFILTVLAMMGTGIMLTYFQIMKVKDTFTFWITWSLLAFYYLTGPVAMILISTKAAAMAFLLPLLQIGWNVFSPIRFWYIFHQFFPISIRWSHLTVSVNILAIGIVEYIMIIFVKEAPDQPPITEQSYYSLFAIITIAGIGWLIMLIYMKQYRNRVPGDLSTVKEVYASTEVIEKFNRKQTGISIILFTALILPAVIIPVMKEFTNLGWSRLTDNAITTETNRRHLRPDLLISLLIVVVVEILLQLLRKIRNELNDLVLVVVSQIINIFVIVLFMGILNRTVTTRKLMGETSTANLVVHTTVKDYITIDVGRYIKDELVNNVKQLYVDDVPENGTVHIRIKFDGKEGIIYEADIHLEIHRCKRAEKIMFVNFYIFRRFNGGFQLYKTSLAYANTSSVHPVFINAIPRCDNYSHAVAERIGFAPEFTTGVLSESGKCLPMTWWFFPYPLPGYPDDKDFYPVVKPPEHDSYYQPEFENDCHPKYSKFNFTCRPIMMNFRYLSNYYKQVYPDEWKTIIRPVTAFFAPERHDRLIVMGVKFPPYFGPGTYDLPRGSFITISLPDALPETELLRVMVLNGIFFGIAWVGYIHFIWIQCPIRLRFFIIFIFFTLMYISSILSKLMLTEFTERTTNLVLAMAVICTSWQVLTSMLFVARWSIHHRKDPPQERWPRF